MLALRRVLGVLVPLGVGFAFTLLVDLNAPAYISPLSAPVAILVINGLAGLVGGFLFLSWWAVALVPLALVAGEGVLGPLIRYGAIAQGPMEIVGPLAVLVLAAMIVPSALGAVLGTPVGKWVAAQANPPAAPTPSASS